MENTYNFKEAVDSKNETCYMQKRFFFCGNMHKRVNMFEEAGDKSVEVFETCFKYFKEIEIRY